MILSRAQKSLQRSMQQSSVPTTVAARRLAQIGQHMSMSTGPGNESQPEKSAADVSPPVVLFETHGSTRVFKLNRPKALNSLNSDMVIPLASKIKAWKDEADVKMILGVGDNRAFCAGGDIKSLAMNTRAGRIKEALEFFRVEVQLDYELARLGKPYVVVMEGITMGGGAGLAYPAPIRIATSTTNFAMPETAIGFAPDVGASFFLAQLDGYIGAWLGLTGESVFGRAVYELGIATHYVKQENLSDLVNELKNVQDPTLPRLVSLITTFSAPSPSESSTYSSKSNPDAPSPLTGSVRTLIDHAFSQPTVIKIYEALRSAIKDEEAKWDDRAKEWAAKQIEIMDTRSPTGMKVALINYRKARKMRDLKGQFNDDLAMCTAFLTSPTNDMVDSIFHKLVDKKRETPTWKPADLNDPSISEEIVARSWFDRQKSKTLDLAPLMDENEITTGTKQDNSTWGEFRAWGIPSEQVIKSYIDGSAKSSGAFALTEKQVKQKLVNDLAERFEIDVGKNEKWANTIRDRVAEVVKNCCSVEDGHKEQYLKWRGYSSA